MADNPQNLNNSPSPGGDGVQSSSAERRAAGLDRTDNQPGQQRVNAAERRERLDAKPGDKVGSRPSLVQSPGEVLPGEASAAAIDAAETARREADQAEQHLKAQDLPQAVIDEMEAGRAALQRNKPRNQAQDSNTADRAGDRAGVAATPTNPNDDLDARKRTDASSPTPTRSSSGV